MGGYDLQLTATDANGQVLPSPPTAAAADDDEEDLPRLPPLVSYCSYVRYGCAFGKWILLAVIINSIAAAICIHAGYFGRDKYQPFDTWKGGLLAGVLLGTAAWLYLSAKVVERDVQSFDHMSQYQQGRISEDNAADTSTATTTTMDDETTSSFVPDYEHIYGQVSRRIDAGFARKKSVVRTANNNHPSHQSHRAPVLVLEGTSSLVNMSLVLWAVMFAAAVYMGTGTLLGKHYAKECDHKNLPNSPNSTNHLNQNDFSNIQSYPTTVQDWISERQDPWGHAIRSYRDDDYIDRNSNNGPVYDFPTAYGTQTGSFCSMTDGTIFFAGLLSHQANTNTNANDDDDPTPGNTNDGKMYDMTDHLVLVESPGGGGPAIYYPEIVNPRMFLPVQNTVQKGSKQQGQQQQQQQQQQLLASQYCFTAAKSKEERKKTNQRSWNAIIRTTPIYCIFTKSNTTDAKDDSDSSSSSSQFEIHRKLIVWKDKSDQNIELSAASSGGEILLMNVGRDDVGMYDSYQYQEVISLNPSSSSSNSNSMDSKTIFHMTYTSNWGGEFERRGHENTRCIQDHVKVPSGIAALVVLVLCGLWLILREGVPSGVAPLALAVVGVIRSFTGEWDHGAAMLSLSAGSLFLHGVLCCGADDDAGRHLCHFLPAWIGRDMYIWGLYGWILSFFFMDLVFGMSEAMISSSILLGLSGVILDHPIPHVMGYTTCGLAVFSFLAWPVFGFGGGELTIGFFLLFLGVGIVGAANCLSNNRRYCVAFLRPISRAGRTMMYGGGGGGERQHHP
jgi:hypothetical protein